MVYSWSLTWLKFSFADDVILVSNSICGLQNQLNVLFDTANRLSLFVNVDKSKIVVFRNGGHRTLREKWNYGEIPVEIVNMYKYLGIYFSARLSFSHALHDMSQRAKKGVICIFKLLWSLGEREIPINILQTVWYTDSVYVKLQKCGD